MADLMKIKRPPTRASRREFALEAGSPVAEKVKRSIVEVCRMMDGEFNDYTFDLWWESLHLRNFDDYTEMCAAHEDQLRVIMQTIASRAYRLVP